MSNRQACEQECPSCGAPVLVGLDHDVAALLVTADAHPTDHDTAVLAEAVGLATYTARHRSGMPELWYRNPVYRPDITRTSTNPIHLQHVCEVSP